VNNHWSPVVRSEEQRRSDAPVSGRRARPEQARDTAEQASGSPAPEVSFEDFQRYFPHTPTALCIKECARLSVMRRYPCPGPVLDVGCGDGMFARIAFDDVEVWGIDIDAAEGRWAAASQAYTQLILGDVTRAALPQGFFATCVANCSLEHVPRLDLALSNISNALKPGGLAYLFVPSAEWASHLLSARILSELGAKALGRQVQSSIDRMFRHYHLYDAAGWRRVVEQSGLEVVELRPVLSTATTVAFEAFLLPSLAGLLNKRMTTRWTNFPSARRLLARPVYEAVRALMARADTVPTAEFLLVARRPEAG
jgi:SAM-dependent methyltransferase